MLRHVTQNCIINFVKGLFPLRVKHTVGILLYKNILLRYSTVRYSGESGVQVFFNQMVTVWR